MSARSILLLLAAGAIGCTQTGRLAVPVVEGARSVLVIEGSGKAAYAAELGAGLVAFALPEGTETVVAAYYGFELSTLGLVPEGVPSAADPSAPLPEALALEETTLGGDLGWRDVKDAPPPAFKAFRLPLGTPEDCLGRGGCFVDLHCEAPCPAQDPPEAPRISPFPELPRLACGAPGTLTTTTVRAADGSVAELEACDPVLDCPGDGLPFASGCAALDSCAPGSWPSVAPGPGVRFVAPGGLQDGLSPSAPSGSLQAAVDTATTVVLAAGRFAESITILRSTKLIGACTQGTILAPAAGATAVQVRGGVARLQGLRIEGGAVQLDARGALELELSRVALSGSSTVAISTAEGAQVRLQTVLVESSQAPGLVARSSTVSLREVVFRDTGGPAAVIGDARSRLRLEGVRVLFSGEKRGQGVVASGALEASELAIRRPIANGILIARGRAELAGVVIRDVGAGARSPIGEGVAVVGGHLDARRLWIDGAKETGVVFLSQATGTLEDLWVRDVRSDTGEARSLLVLGSSVLAAQRVLIQRSAGAGAYVADSAHLGLQEAIILDGISTILDGLPTQARGVQVGAEGSLDLSRAYLANNGGDGVGFLAAAADHSAITDVIAEANLHAGIWVQGQRAVDLSRVRLGGNRYYALEVGELTYATTVVGVDVDLRGQFGSPCDIRSSCTGIGVRHASGNLDLRRFRVLDMVEAGLDLSALTTVRLHQGAIEGNGIGLSLRGDQSELTAAVDRVRFLGNAQNISVRN